MIELKERSRPHVRGRGPSFGADRKKRGMGRERE